MGTEHQEQSKGSMRDLWMQLPPDIQAFIPEDMLAYYERTNDMHCNPDTPGGSKFLSSKEGGVDNIFEVIQRMGYEKIKQRIQERNDDRTAFIQAGASENAFLPATRTLDTPPAVPEALYFKVDDMKGRIGIIKLGELQPTTPVKVLQEKEGAPLSFSAIHGKKENFPQTNFATIIVGKSPGSDKDVLWTIHPGAPIRPVDASRISECPWKNGDRITVQNLLEKGMNSEDSIKIIPEV